MSLDRRDSAPAMPKCIVTDDAFDWSRDVQPERAVGRNHHLRNTRARRIDDAQRQTFASTNAARSRRCHRRGLSSTCRSSASPLSNSCPCMRSSTTAFSSMRSAQLLGLQHRRVLRAGAFVSSRRIGSMKCASRCRQLHAAGIEVILDVVYNHTCEGNELGPTVSWRGLDNASLPPDSRRRTSLYQSTKRVAAIRSIFRIRVCCK